MGDRNLFCTPLFLRLFIPFGLGYFLSVLLGSANATMASALISEFSLSPGDLGFMSSIYLIAFGAAQFPLGVFLDSRGARATLAPLLLFAVAGALVFSQAHGLGALVISRALIGIGLSGSLMAAFKGYADRLPAATLPMVYSLQSFMGGLGGMCATRPMAVAFGFFGWRPVFVALAFFCLAISALIWFSVPKYAAQAKTRHVGFMKLLLQMFSYFKDRRFWDAAAISTCAQAVMFSFLYLWIAPWMHDVAGMESREAEFYMMLAFFGTALGYLLNGILADFLKRRAGLSWERLYLLSGLLLTILLGLICAINGRAAAPLWAVVMFLCNMTMISFPIMRTLYAENEVGRVLSLLNFTIFLCSFLAQWFIGAVLECYPVTRAGFSPAGYQAAIAVIVALNAAGVLWYAYSMKRTKAA